MMADPRPAQKTFFVLLCLAAGMGWSACQPAVRANVSPSPAASASPASLSSPSPSPTPAGSATQTPPPTATPAPLPSPTATPRTYVVKQGEDFGGIAYRYGITLKALMDANPKVNPNMMSVGTVLVIPAPANPATPSAQQTTQPTALPIQLSAPVCYPTGDEGLDCFTLASNPLSIFVENVTVVFRLANTDTGEINSLTATTPLNLIPPGWSLPLHALFLPPVPQHQRAAVELQNALPYTASDQRYINVRVEKRQDSIAADGLSAVVTGDLILAGDASEKASTAWVASTAFDGQNQVVGERRWEATGPLTGGQPVHFVLRVYSAGPAIDHLTLLAEARR